MFGDVGQLGLPVQKLVGAELQLDHVPRLRMNKMVEIVLDQKVTANLATHNLVRVSTLFIGF